ncbi:transferase family protein [Penicillium hetheringtonii]|nr:transferase family protein [Penicillium hetheringtonii]
MEIETTMVQSERLFPSITPIERAVPLSLLDATTTDFASTIAIWLFERPADSIAHDEFDLFDHFRQSLKVSLNDYPQWTGLLKSITTLDSTKLEKEVLQFPPHARRFGRVYAHFGSSQDPGVEFITATSTATIEALSPASRVKERPLYDRQKVPLESFLPSRRLASAMKELKVDEGTGLLPPSCVIQLTKTACGGFVLGVKLAHPLADVHTLVHFVKDWARISRWLLGDLEPTPKSVIKPVFEPDRLDAMAMGDINGEEVDPKALQQIKNLPLHRYDWWAAPSQCPWPQEIPEPFQNQDLPIVGKKMPWSEWDFSAPVSHYTVHLTRCQVEKIWNSIDNRNLESRISERISRHDAVLAHIWSCIARARNQQEDRELVHCNLTYGIRPIFNLGDNFIGSPIMNIKVEMIGKELASTDIPEDKQNTAVAQCIRKTINQINRPEAIAAHIHSVAFEKAPQRIWQAFLGSRHLIVTSWARVGIYEVDFGLNGPIRYAEGVIPDLDGDVLIKDAPPSDQAMDRSERSRSSWTDNGVDVSIHIRAEDMERLIRDPRLLP